MRAAAERAGRMNSGFEGGAKSFFYRGGNGRGKKLLTAEQIERCERHCAALLSSDAVSWLASGSKGSGIEVSETSS